MEESAPVDTEVRREAETVRQVRERDGGSLSQQQQTSPTLVPNMSTGAGGEGLEDIPEDSTMGLDLDKNTRGTSMPNFSRQASRNSEGTSEYWNRFGKDFRTPPPPIFPPHRGSSGFSVTGYMDMDSPAAEPQTRSESLASTQGEDLSLTLTTSNSATAAAAAPIKKFGKRAREDDFDVSSIKRRAVSPSLSVGGSPVVASRAERDGIGGGWNKDGSLQLSRDNSMNGTVDHGGQLRSDSGGSAGQAGLPGMPIAKGKRVGLQNMTDTNDGLMKMSIE